LKSSGFNDIPPYASLPLEPFGTINCAITPNPLAHWHTSQPSFFVLALVLVLALGFKNEYPSEISIPTPWSAEHRPGKSVPRHPL